MTKEIREPSSINSDMAWILGVMCGDGSLENYNKGHSYRVSLTTIDSDFAKTFINKINKLFNLKEKFNPKIYTNNTGSRYYRVQICSKLLYNFFRRFDTFGTFTWRVPKEIQNGSINLKLNFLKGFYDSEGSINTYREKYQKIRITSVNKNGLEEVLKLLNCLGIAVNLIKEIRCYSLNIYKKEQIKSYMKNVGFSFKNEVII